MAILNRFLQLLELLETVRDFLEFLHQSRIISFLAASCLYSPMRSLGYTSISAVTLACAAALIVFSLIEDAHA